MGKPKYNKFDKQHNREKKEQKDQKRYMLCGITKGAKAYEENLQNKQFLILYDGKATELSFSSGSFLHLCGVETELYAKQFYQKALKSELYLSDFYFSERHTAENAYDKCRSLKKIPKLMEQNCSVLLDVKTRTHNYMLAITNGNDVLCFNPLEGKIKPHSFRANNNGHTKYKSCHGIDFVLSKGTDEKTYHTVTRGDPQNLYDYMAEHKIFAYSVDIGKEQTKEEIERD